MTTIYEPSGLFQLTHPAESLPEVDQERLKELKAEALSLGYELKRIHRRYKLWEYIEPILESEAHDELLRVINIENDGKSYRDFQNVFFNSFSLVSESIDILKRRLPGFLRELKEKEGIDAELELKFADQAAKENTVHLYWVDGELERAITGPEAVERITEAELHRRQQAGELGEAPGV